MTIGQRLGQKVQHDLAPQRAGPLPVGRYASPAAFFSASARS